MSISANLLALRSKIKEVCTRLNFVEPRLVAVSKTKPIESLKEAYAEGQRHFGENYVKELIEKAPLLPLDINWHFIGHLQSNKAKILVKNVPNLWVVEGVDSIKLASKLNDACVEVDRHDLLVFVQVNTSGEDNKSGISLIPGEEGDGEDALAVAKFIKDKCPNLKLKGLMTIGSADGTNPVIYFKLLNELKKKIQGELGLSDDELELSMGMSGDWELAVQEGSSNIRVGSTIFGSR